MESDDCILAVAVPLSKDKLSKGEHFLHTKKLLQRRVIVEHKGLQSSMKGRHTTAIYINVGQQGLQLCQRNGAARLLHARLQLIHSDGAAVVHINALQK